MNNNTIHEPTDKPFTIAEMYHLFSNHDTIIFRLEGMGQTVSDTILFKQAFERIEELERIATEYESNKHYIELGKAIKEAFEIGAEIQDCGTYVIESVEGLLEWAEGRNND